MYRECRRLGRAYDANEDRLIANTLGDSEPLRFDPVNWWAGTLILAGALDLSRQHVPSSRERS